MSGKIFYTIGIAFTSGIFIRSFFDSGVSGMGILIVVGIASMCAWRLKKRAFGFESPLFLLGLLCIFGALGIMRMHLAATMISSFQEYEGRKVSVIGKIVREPEIRESMVHLYIEPVDVAEHSREFILVATDRFKSEELDLSYGDMVRAEGVLRKPESFITDTGRVFDYVAYLRSRGVQYTIAFADVTSEVQESGTILGYLFKGKYLFMESIERILPEPHAGLGEGILLGVKRALGEDLEQTFRETGIIHVVVLSGYNIMIVVSFFMFFLSYMFFPKARLALGICCIILFAILVGPSATVIRASIMAILLTIAQTIKRSYVVLRALMLAGVAMLILNPYLLAYDPGFQLSFLATLGLILLSPYIEERLTKIPKTLGIRNVATATIATQIFVLPLLLYHTGMFSSVSFFVNVLVLPMIPVAMLFTFIAGLVGMLSSTIGTIVGYLAYLSLAYIILIAKLFGSIPFASFTITQFPFWIVVCMYVLLAVFMYTVYSDDDEIEGSSQKVNDYEGWTIVEEKGIVSEMQRVSENTKNTLPFR